MTKTYNSVISNILDGLDPFSQVTRRKRKSYVWYDEDCPQQQRLTQERHCRLNRKEDPVVKLKSLKIFHKLFRSEVDNSEQVRSLNKEMIHEAATVV